MVMVNLVLSNRPYLYQVVTLDQGPMLRRLRSPCKVLIYTIDYTICKVKVKIWYEKNECAINDRTGLFWAAM